MPEQTCSYLPDKELFCVIGNSAWCGSPATTPLLPTCRMFLSCQTPIGRGLSKWLLSVVLALHPAGAAALESGYHERPFADCFTANAPGLSPHSTILQAGNNPGDLVKTGAEPPRRNQSAASRHVIHLPNYHVDDTAFLPAPIPHLPMLSASGRWFLNKSRSNQQNR
jgi:hypothetical protein